MIEIVVEEEVVADEEVAVDEMDAVGEMVAAEAVAVEVVAEERTLVSTYKTRLPSHLCRLPMSSGVSRVSCAIAVASGLRFQVVICKRAKDVS